MFVLLTTGLDLGNTSKRSLFRSLENMMVTETILQQSMLSFVPKKTGFNIILEFCERSYLHEI